MLNSWCAVIRDPSLRVHHLGILRLGELRHLLPVLDLTTPNKTLATVAFGKIPSHYLYS